jgi:hypothetical protein
MLGALVADLLPRPRFPVALLLCWFAFSEPLPMTNQYFSPPAPEWVQGWLRLLVPVLLTVVLLARPERDQGGHVHAWAPRIFGRETAAPAGSGSPATALADRATAEQELEPLVQAH